MVVAGGEVLGANEPLERLLGQSAAELIGRPIRAILPPPLVQQLARGAQAEWTFDDVRLEGAGGSLTPPQRVFASVIRLSGGAPTNLLRFRPNPIPRPRPAADANRSVERLAAAAQRVGKRVGGAEVRLVGMDRVRHVLGDRGAAFQERVADLCETTIASEVGADDVFMETPAGDYVVCFACADEDEADRRAGRLQAQIDARLFAESTDVAADDDHQSRAALDALTLEVDAAFLGETSSDGVSANDLLETQFAERRQRRLADFNEQLGNLATRGALELLPLQRSPGGPTSLLRARWVPPDLARLQGLAERAGQLDELELTLDLRRLALLDAAERQGVLERASVILDLHVGTIERRKTWDTILPVIQQLGGSPRGWLIPNLTAVPETIYPGRLRDALMTLTPFSRSQTVTLSAPLLASFDLSALPCRFVMLNAIEAEAAVDSDLPARIRTRLKAAGIKLAIDGGSAELALRYGAGLWTKRPDAP